MPTYWKGLMLAAVLDVVWISGCRSPITEPTRSAAAHFRAVDAPWEHLLDIDRHIDRLMLHLQQHPTDVDAMARLARRYAAQGRHDEAIGPLARALQLDPSRRRLWVALDHAVEHSGRAQISDAELVRRAAEFVELMEMGHGC
ncbi:MAG: tetratricopeptide repeat protein [Gemmatimonadales bacterium]